MRWAQLRGTAREVGKGKRGMSNPFFQTQQNKGTGGALGERTSLQHLCPSSREKSSVSRCLHACFARTERWLHWGRCCQFSTDVQRYLCLSPTAATGSGALVWVSQLLAAALCRFRTERTKEVLPCRRQLKFLWVLQCWGSFACRDMTKI